MLNLNDDMDDLIRQAADEYPLKTQEGKDWDKVFAGLQSVAPVAPLNNKKRWWLLWLLFPLGIAASLLYWHHDTPASSVASDKAATSIGTIQESKNTSAEKNNTAPAQVGENNIDTNASTAKNSSVAENKIETENDNYSTRSSTKSIKKSGGIATTNRVDVQAKKVGVESDHFAGLKPAMPAISSHDEINKKHVIRDGNTSVNDDVNTAGNTIKDIDKSNTANANNADITAANNNLSKASATVQNDSATTVATAKLKHTTPVKTKGLYAGIAGSLDATTVKLHKIDKLGYTTSVLVGYRFNNHWSIESGLMWDDKKYYSPGKYFDKTKTGIPAASNIHFLNGVCRMLEVPLDVKYDFNSKRLSGFYIAAGLSNYIMKKESYEYHATYSGNYYVGNKDYKNSTTNLFSVANISGGYQFIFKNNNSLRIEPYFKVPLSGLGIGKLPFSSTGISAAYTLPLHH